MNLVDLFWPSVPDQGEGTGRVRLLERAPIEDQIIVGIRDTLDAVLGSVIESGVRVFRQTPLGQRAEAEAKRQAIMDMLQSPWTIIVVVLAMVGILVLAGKGGRL